MSHFEDPKFEKTGSRRRGIGGPARRKLFVRHDIRSSFVIGRWSAKIESKFPRDRRKLTENPGATKAVNDRTVTGALGLFSRGKPHNYRGHEDLSCT
ncbi:Hypothetical protein NTJ_11767 [Nesidiocoris tenuis]|uniref:Uncharacterized protein n=1 Tax=Nesidiocoris tenuis TaxID=355587 RepID=A0ABN7B3G7_9HEMI|nr:Hypothetical protein NTJ_11767 [Nesidiocoris tenuis]